MDNALRPLGPFRQLEHIDRGFRLQAGLLIRLLVGQPPRPFLVFQFLQLHAHPGFDPDEEHVAEEVIVHLDVHVFLDHFVPVFPKDGGETGQRQIRSGRHPLRREQKHGLELAPVCPLGTRSLDVDQVAHHSKSTSFRREFDLD